MIPNKFWRPRGAVLDAHVQKVVLSRRYLAYRVDVLQRSVFDRVAAPSTLVGGFFAGAAVGWLTTCNRRESAPAGPDVSFWRRARMRIQRDVGRPFWPALMVGVRLLIGILEKHRERNNRANAPAENQ